MARPSWQSIDEAYQQPERIIDALPDSTERRSAKRCLKQSYDYVKEIRERLRNEEPDPAPADAAVTLSGGAFLTSCYRLAHLHVHQAGACSVAG